MSLSFLTTVRICKVLSQPVVVGVVEIPHDADIVLRHSCREVIQTVDCFLLSSVRFCDRGTCISLEREICTTNYQ